MEPMNKITLEKQNIIFENHINELKLEMKKSSVEGKYIETLSNTFEDLNLPEIRYTVEKTYDRYEAILDLMDKYSDNFDENEFLKYNSRYNVLDKVLTFMVQNSLGEYKISDMDG
jgi:hypothetical protein